MENLLVCSCLSVHIKQVWQNPLLLTLTYQKPEHVVADGDVGQDVSFRSYPKSPNDSLPWSLHYWATKTHHPLVVTGTRCWTVPRNPTGWFIPSLQRRSSWPEEMTTERYQTKHSHPSTTVAPEESPPALL